MTEKLKTLMHDHASSVDFVAPDLDSLMRAGDRQIRRRRGLGIVGGVAAAAVVGALAVPLWGLVGGEAPREEVAVEPSGPAELTWVAGSVLHTPRSETDLGHAVAAYVRTDTGYVFADLEGTVWSWVDGETTEVGATDVRFKRLVSDDESPLAGWVDPTGARPAFVVLNQATGEVTRDDEHTTPSMGNAADEADPAYFYAIDDGTAYWRDERGAVGVTLATGKATVIDARARNGFDISDVEDGVLAFATENGTFVGTSQTDGIDLPRTYGGFGVFSPDARFYSSEGDEPEIFDATTGKQISLELDGRAFATGYEWLDEHTIAMLAAKRASVDAEAELLTCTVPEGSCDEVARLGTFNELPGTLALPIGTGISD